MFQIQKTRNLKNKCFSKLSAILLSATLPFCLQGCMGVYEGGFECPPGEGVGCKSISDVNQMVNWGELPPPEINKQDPQTKENCSCGAAHPDIFSSPSEAPKIWYSTWGLEEV